MTAQKTFQQMAASTFSRSLMYRLRASEPVRRVYWSLKAGVEIIRGRRYNQIRKLKRQIAQLEETNNLLRERLSEVDDKEKQRSLELYYAAKQLRRAVWSGFGTVASAKLRSLQADRRLGRKVLARSAWTLSVWYKSVGKLEEALDQITLTRAAKSESYLGLRLDLVEIDVLLRLGRFDDARVLLEDTIQQSGETPELCLCAANLAAFAQGRGEAAQVRLEWLNKPFISAGLAPLELKDPNKPLSFYNLAASPVPPPASCPWKVAVLMPAYNAGETIGTAIQSVLNQSWTNLELLVVDDGSSDRTWSTVESFAAQDSRVRPIKHDQNKGAYAARNTALHHASSDFVTVNDADDWSHPQRLALQIDNLLSGVIVNTTSNIRVDRDMVIAVSTRGEMKQESFPSLMTRTQHVLELGGWDEARMGADAEFYSRLLVRHQQSRVRILNEVPLNIQLQRDSSLTSASYTGLSTLRFGARCEYAESYSYWHGSPSGDATCHLKLPANRRAFPTPAICKPSPRQCLTYDILWVSDFSPLDARTAVRANMLRAAKELGLRSACFHWPRLESADKRVNVTVRQLLHEGIAEAVVAGETVRCSLVIANDSLCLTHLPDILPEVNTEGCILIVDQAPTTHPIYGRASGHIDDALVNAQSVFGVAPILAPVSPIIRDAWRIAAPDHKLTSLDWMPLIDQTVRPSPPSWDNSRAPIVGTERSSRAANSAASGRVRNVEDPIQTRIFHGAEIPLNSDGLPNSIFAPPGTVDARNFLTAIDFFVHCPEDDPFEAFPYGALQAMAGGRPAILPWQFQTTFHDAAVYADASEVVSVLQSLWKDRIAYNGRIERALKYVEKNCSLKRLEEYLAFKERL
jgi:hypothetical protein